MGAAEMPKMPKSERLAAEADSFRSQGFEESRGQVNIFDGAAIFSLEPLNPVGRTIKLKPSPENEGLFPSSPSETLLKVAPGFKHFQF